MTRTRTQTQVECLFRTLHAMRQPTAQREVIDNAHRQLKAYAVWGGTLKIRLRAIEALQRGGVMAPMVYGGPNDAA